MLQDFGGPQLSALGWAVSPVGAETPDTLLNQLRTISVLAWLCFLLQTKTRCVAPQNSSLGDHGLLLFGLKLIVSLSPTGNT